MMRLLGGGGLSPPAVRLDGERVYLRPAALVDWQEWAELRGRSRAFLTPWEPVWPTDTLTRSAFARRIRRQAVEWRDDEGYSFLTFDRRSDTLVGGLGLGNVRRGVALTATLGYWVGQAYARQGYTTAAVRLALDFAFGRLGLHRVEASCLPANEASRGLLEALGFTYEGYARGYLRINGDWCDHRLYAILKDDWSR